MTYEFYKLNYDKLTKSERRGNKEFQKRFLKEAEEATILRLKQSMDERLKTYMENK